MNQALSAEMPRCFFLASSLLPERCQKSVGCCWTTGTGKCAYCFLDLRRDRATQTGASTTAPTLLGSVAFDKRNYLVASGIGTGYCDRWRTCCRRSVSCYIFCHQHPADQRHHLVCPMRAWRLQSWSTSLHLSAHDQHCTAKSATPHGNQEIRALLFSLVIV